MAVEHKDDTQPISSKLKALQDENVEVAHNGNAHHDVDKENNNNSNNNNNTNNTHNDDTDQTNTQTDTSTEETGLEGEVDQLAIADPSNFSVKHPLQNSWTMWYDNPGRRSHVASWVENLKKITTFSTVEDFWRVFNNLKPASSLAQGSNYHIFKEGIDPKWEDPANSKGGKWTVLIPPKNRNSALDQMWLWAVLSCIGETVLAPDEVCGLVVSVRKAGDRVQIWTRDSANEQACLDLGRSLKQALELPDNVIIGYQSHADSMKKSNSRNRYEV